jgi:hypothetical protein
MARAAARAAAAAAGADFPVCLDTCDADHDCGVELLQARVLDAVKVGKGKQSNLRSTPGMSRVLKF